MKGTQITLLICIAAIGMLLWGHLDRIKMQKNRNGKVAIFEKLGIAIGIPLLFVAVIGFIWQSL